MEAEQRSIRSLGGRHEALETRLVQADPTGQKVPVLGIANRAARADSDSSGTSPNLARACADDWIQIHSKAARILRAGRVLAEDDRRQDIIAKWTIGAQIRVGNVQ
jgi:hypothetical protein